MSITVKAVAYTDPEMKDFLRMPYQVQGDNPLYVPPLMIQQKDVLDPKKGPFHKYGTAQYFVAYDNGRPVGRLSAHLNPRHEKLHSPDDGFFGFFECENNPEASRALFDAAAEWLAKHGKKVILGPMGFGIYEDVGILIDGFDTMPALLQTHNPPYYQDLVESYGFTKAQDWVAFGGLPKPDLPIRGNFEEKIPKILEQTGYTMRQPTADEIISRSDEALKLFNDAWGPNWGHVPFTSEEFKHILKELKPVLRPNLMRAAFDENDEMIAYLINAPDINPAIRAMHGRLTPWGIARLYWEARYRTPHRIRSLIMGVRKEHQGRRIHLALMMSIYLEFLKFPLENWDCSLIAESNRATLRAYRVFEAEIYKTWRIYSYTMQS
ncbi:hypothetical protein [Oceanidesulfovibrio marinus]|uniref:N-acetyltransferase domain-containing protein n=1 Tax=Oceanidesulfovibrio marinus TaxID=370038 RepID=A0A6P1ZIH5_9BACT|nr:hypothetical protein [Oceanidesulfovibrio marinus]TVM34598.1 hypothetical protein DQK91_08480 [Oceanidesulfovibrio marinus]